MKKNRGKQPNILYIMSDDHASNAIGCYTSILSDVVHTPHLDSLYNDGMKLENFYSTNAICTPARATIMTGQYGHVNGVRTLDDHWKPSEKTNMSHLFQQAGYETGLFGKWHLHCTPEGFDQYKYLYNDPSGNEQGLYYDPSFMEKETGIQGYKGYVTDIITDMTIEFLEKRDRTKPFFVMCHHKAPHDFWEYAKRHEALYDGMDIPVPDSLFEDRGHRCIGSRDFGSSVTPRSTVRSLYSDFIQEDYCTGQLKGTESMSFTDKGLAAYQKYLKDYLRTVAGIDDSVGRLLEMLDESGDLDDTIIVYTSDQGIFLGEHDYQDKRWGYEESLKAPFLIRYPQCIEPGQSSRELMANIDVAPTLLDMAGIAIPEMMQGMSQKGLLYGEADPVLRDSVYFRYWMHRAHRHDNPAHYGIRTDRYKLLFYYGLPLDAAGAKEETSPPGWELYDMIEDPLEMKNVYGDQTYAHVVKAMKEKLYSQKRYYDDLDERYPELMKCIDELEQVERSGYDDRR